MKRRKSFAEYSVFFRRLFFDRSVDVKLQLFRYVIVGGLCFVVDASLLYIITEMGVHYLVSSALSFLVALSVNYLLSTRFIFMNARVGRRLEMVAYTLIAVTGLLFTEALMYFFTDFAGWYYLHSRAASAFIVLIWNFAARKLLLYRSA